MNNGTLVSRLGSHLAFSTRQTLPPLRFHQGDERGVSMKVDHHGKAKILSQAEIQLLFSQGFQTSRDSEALLLTVDRALFGICLFTACRIREVCTIRFFVAKLRTAPGN